MLGVSSPSGIAVTSPRPVFRARRKAITVKIRSPTSTPTAVPGIIRVRTNVPGEPEADQEAGHEDHVADVVEHQAEEGVDVASTGPGVAVGKAVDRWWRTTARVSDLRGSRPVGTFGVPDRASGVELSAIVGENGAESKSIGPLR